MKQTSYNLGVLISGSAFVILALLFHTLIGDGLLQLPRDFSYSADILSLDNFYDEENAQYSGEELSITTFSYTTVAHTNEFRDIENIFDVRTLQGDTIFSVSRTYGIDAQTGAHVAGRGDKDRSGFLFAPRGVGKEEFIYWHINYDEPAEMRFVREDVLHGLPVHVFESHYTADQTNNLIHLPDVPEERGVNLDIYLRTWIEPVSGYLVKYQDETTAYYYDRQTGERMFPWNHFSNTYTPESVRTHVFNAKQLKQQILLVTDTLPKILIVFGFACVLYWLFMRIFRHHYRRACKVLLLFGTLLMLGFIGYGLFEKTQDVPTPHTRIGILEWVDNPEHQKNIEAFKQAVTDAGFIEGENVTYITPEPSHANQDRHRQSATELIRANVDLIYSLTTPGTLLVKELAETIPIVFSIVTYPVEAGIVASLGRSENNLVGTRNWVPLDEQLDIITELMPTIQKIGFVHRKGEPNSEIQLIEMQKEAAQRGIAIIPIQPITPDEIIPLLREAYASGIDSIYAACDTLIQAEQGEDQVIAFAKEHVLPDFACISSGVTKGSLAGLVADLEEIGKLAGGKAVQILAGIPPSALQTTTTLEPQLYINTKRAEELGIALSQQVLIDVDRLIE